jgi:hypothetical protein
MSSKLTINCYVMDDAISDIIPIEIETSRFVQELKNHIQSEIRSLDRNIPATDFEIYHVAISTGHEFEKNLANLDLAGEKLLRPLELVSTVFTSPPRASDLHVVLKPKAFGKCFHIL